MVLAVHANGELIGDDGHRERAGDVAPSVRPIAHLDGAVCLIARVAGDEVDGTGVGVTTIERALRALDDFNALERVEIERLNVAVVVDAVDEVGGARLHAELYAGQDVRLAADYRTVRLATESLREAEAWRECRQLVDVLDALGRHGFARERGHGNRGFLQRFVGAACGDDDFVEAVCGESRQRAERDGDGAGEQTTVQVRDLHAPVSSQE